MHHRDRMKNQTPLQELLRKGMGRNRADVVADAVEQRPELFAELTSIYLGSEEPESRVAAWAVDLCAELHPEWLYPYIEEMAAALPHFRHDAFKRHTLRMLMRLPLPEKELGVLVNTCFEWLTSPGEAVAQKVYSMEILYRVIQIEPDLKEELRDSIAWRLEEETAGFRSKGMKIIKKISQ